MPLLILIYIPDIPLDPDITPKIGYTFLKVTREKECPTW